MSDFQSKINNLVEGKIDFEGQKYVEQIARNGLIAISVLAVIIGAMLQDLQLLFIMFGIMVTFLTLVVVPPWPYLKRNPVKWLPPVQVSSETKKTS